MKDLKEIVISSEEYTHLVDISEYNHNYYKLPEDKVISNYNVVLEMMEENSDKLYYVLGRAEEGAFEEDENHILMVSSHGAEYCYPNLIIELDNVV